MATQAYHTSIIGHFPLNFYFCYFRKYLHCLLQSVKDGSITKLVSASGGNAGMATAYAGRTLNIPTTVVIPETTPKLMISKLKEEGANVQVRYSY